MLSIIVNGRFVARKDLPVQNGTIAAIKVFLINQLLVLVNKKHALATNEVLYLLPLRPNKVPCQFSNAYWLEIVSERTISTFNHEIFYALSPSGITQFQCLKNFQSKFSSLSKLVKASIKVIDFTDLTNWLHEKLAFDHITQMKSLGRIQQMIFYFSWKRNVLQQKHLRVRNYLSTHLLHCDVLAQPLLLEIQNHCKKV